MRRSYAWRVTASATGPPLATVPHTDSLLGCPIRIGHVELPNRVVMQPIYLNTEWEHGKWTEVATKAMAAFYAERAHFGAKLIIVGGLGTSRLGSWRKDSLALNTFDAAKSLRQVTDAIHEEGGHVVAQAFHPGRAARRKWMISATNEKSTVQPFPNTAPIQLHRFLVDMVVSEYERFARLAEEAGFDGMELPVSDGSLLHNFLSTATNHRTDEFGGATLETRLEMLMRVLETVRQSLRHPDRFILSLRLCLHDLKPGGTPMEDTLRVAELLAKSGRIDLLNTSVGMHDSPVQTMASFVPQGTFARSCAMVKERLRKAEIDVPVVASHRIHSVAVAEKLLKDESCDMVGIARPLLADAQFIHKALQQREEDILPCIGCNHCVNRLYTHQRVTCALNPISGYELERGWRPAKYRKHIAVVGAGPAGITCALTLWRRGHDVTLFEREAVIGGQLNLAKRVPGKESYQDVLEYWTRQLRNSSINLQLETEFTREEVARNHQFFHAVVLAHGSIPRPISSSVLPGASESKLVVPYRRILDGSVVAGRRVAILGNGAISHDVASYLLHDPRVSRSVEYYLDEWGVNLATGELDVSSNERAPRNNRDVIVFNKCNKDADLSRGTGWSQKLWIRRHGGTILETAMTECVDAEGLHISMMNSSHERYVVPCDTVVWCNGQLPNVTAGTWIFEWMKDGAKTRGEMIKDFSIYSIGSCRDPQSTEGNGEQDMLMAVHEGYEVGMKV